MEIEEIRGALRAAGLHSLADEAERLTLPAIRISTEMVDEDTLAVGASKVGGRPDLPSDATWPEHDGRPMGFLAQFHLAEVAQYDVEHLLPSTGMLYFFYDFTHKRCGVYPEDRDAWQVLYFDDGPELSRSIWPASLLRRHRMQESLIQFSSTVTITQEPDWVVTVLASNDEIERLHEAVESHFRPPVEGVIEGTVGNNFAYRATRHQLLGHPFLVHYGTMPLVCESLVAGRPNPLFTVERMVLDDQPHESWNEGIKAELASAYKHWRLLFQLGNVSGLSFPRAGDICDLWARGGLMYFWIERDRLAQRDFSRVWMLGASQY